MHAFFDAGRARRLVAGGAVGDDAADAGPYAIEWPPTEFRDEVLGRLGGVFRGTVMQNRARPRLLRRRRVLAAAGRRSDRPDGAARHRPARSQWHTPCTSCRPVSKKASAGGGTTKSSPGLAARARVAQGSAGNVGAATLRGQQRGAESPDATVAATSACRPYR